MRLLAFRKRLLVFQLKGECQILLYVWIWQIVQGTFGCRITQSIVKKDLSCGFSIDLCYKMPVFRDAVPRSRELQPRGSRQAGSLRKTDS